MWCNGCSLSEWWFRHQGPGKTTYLRGRAIGASWRERNVRRAGGDEPFLERTDLTKSLAGGREDQFTTFLSLEDSTKWKRKLR
jgi:hypothetical protein